MTATYNGRDRILSAASRMLRYSPAGKRTLFKVVQSCVGSPERFILWDGARYFVVDCKDFDVAMRVALDRCYEPVVGSLFLSDVLPGDVVIDAGANKGYYTMLAVEKVGTTGRVLAYEPDPRNVSDLRETTELNGFKNLEVIPRALSKESGTATFDISGWSEANSAWGKIVDDGSSSGATVQVSTCRLDSDLESLGVESVGVLKMDIQGGERDAVVGMDSLLAGKRIRTCLVELHDMQLNEEECHAVVDAFMKHGYRGRAYDQRDFTVAEAKLAISGKSRLDLMSRGIRAEDYSYKQRHSAGGYIKPLQFLLRATE